MGPGGEGPSRYPPVSPAMNVGANGVNLHTFFSDMKISSDLHQSHGASDRRLGAIDPLAPAPHTHVATRASQDEVGLRGTDKGLV